MAATDLRTYTNPLHKPEEEPSPTTTQTKRSPTSDKKKGFTKKLPLLRRSKSSKDVRSTIDTVPERDMPALHELQRQELERLANTSADASGLAKWSEMLSAETKKQKRQALKNRDRVVSDDVAAASAKWVVGTSSSSSSSSKAATTNNINMRAYFSGSSGADSARNAENAARTNAFPQRTTQDDLALKNTGAASRMEALALSPRSCEGSAAPGGGGRLNQRCARAQLAAMPYALHSFEAGPER